jgi:hypothetical protein
MRRGTKKSEEGKEKSLFNFLHLIFDYFFKFWSCFLHYKVCTILWYNPISIKINGSLLILQSDPFFQLILYILFFNIFEHFKFISHTLIHVKNYGNNNFALKWKFYLEYCIGHCFLINFYRLIIHYFLEFWIYFLHFERYKAWWYYSFCIKFKRFTLIYEPTLFLA